MHVGPCLAEKPEGILAIGNKPQPDIGTTRGEGLLHEIDIGGIVLHQEHFLHYGAPSCSSLRVLNTWKGAWTEGADATTGVLPHRLQRDAGAGSTGHRTLQSSSRQCSYSSWSTPKIAVFPCAR